MANPARGRQEVWERLQAAEETIRALGVERLALFGSFARDEARPDSDVDILVEFADDRKTFDAFLDLAELLEEILDRKVELVTVESLSPYIGPRILAEAEDVVGAPGSGSTGFLSFLGAWEGEQDLSTRYKQDLTASLEAKYGGR